MGTHPIFESDFDCLTEISQAFCGDIDIWKGTGSGLRVKR